MRPPFYSPPLPQSAVAFRRRRRRRGPRSRRVTKQIVDRRGVIGDVMETRARFPSLLCPRRTPSLAHTLTQTRTRTRPHLLTRTNRHPCSHAQTHTYSLTHRHTLAHTHRHTLTDIDTQSHTHTHSLKQTLAHYHTHTHTYTHLSSHSGGLPPLLLPSSSSFLSSAQEGSRVSASMSFCVPD